MIVVDTSVLVDLFRGARTPAVDLLRRLEVEDTPFAIPMVCCQELLQGARDEREWKLLHEYLDTQRLLTARDPWATHVAAARIFFDCRRRGITIRSTVDCWIAQLVIEADGVLMHDDEDFERIASSRPLQTLRA